MEVSFSALLTRNYRSFFSLPGQVLEAVLDVQTSLKQAELGSDAQPVQSNSVHTRNSTPVPLEELVSYENYNFLQTVVLQTLPLKTPF